jgi:putative transposase
MLKAFKFRIYPDNEQEILINKTFGCCRWYYNNALADCTKQYAETKKSKIVTPAKFKKTVPWLSEVDSLALCNSQLNLQAAFNNFFRRLKTKTKNKGFPKFHKKGVNDSYKTNHVKIKDDKLCLPKMDPIRMVMHRNVTGNIKSATIKKTATEKYFVSILVEDGNTFPPKVNIKKSIGLDYSQEEFYVDSEGQKANVPHFLRSSQDKISRLQQQMSHSKRNSKRRERYRKKIAYQYERLVNRRTDWLYKKALELVREYDLISVEDLNLQNLAKVGYGKKLHDNSFGMFRTILEYECKKNGKTFFKIDKWFPSSKLCSHCNSYYDDLKLKDREWDCPECGTHHDRDINAAINIRNSGDASNPVTDEEYVFSETLITCVDTSKLGLLYSTPSLSL